MQPGQTVLLCPTIAPQDAEALAAALAERGIGCIDAPMSGGPARARDGSMSLMLAAPQALLARHAPLLEVLSSRRFVISERAGDGARTKLVNNLLAGINLVGAAEAMALAERLGLDLSTTLDVIEQSSGQSWIGSDRMRRAIAGDLEPRAHDTLAGERHPAGGAGGPGRPALPRPAGRSRRRGLCAGTCRGPGLTGTMPPCCSGCAACAADRAKTPLPAQRFTGRVLTIAG